MTRRFDDYSLTQKLYYPVSQDGDSQHGSVYRSVAVEKVGELD